MYEIRFTRSAAKELDDLETDIYSRVVAGIEELVDAPRPVGGLS